MTPLNNYISIELIDEPSLILQPYKDASPKGKVTGVSPKVKDVKVGDIIYYRAKTGYEYKNNHFVKAEDILAKYGG